MTLFLKRVYADAAAATPLLKKAEQELVRLLSIYGNPGALHREALLAKDELESARKKLADALGAHADEIILTGSGSEANNLGLQGLLRPLLREGKEVHVITSAIEHASILEPLRALVQEGLRLTELPVDTEGKISIQELTEAIVDSTVLISIQMVNSEIGTIQNIRDIAKEVRRSRQDRVAPLYVHTDASQAPLWLPLMVDKLGVDLMTLDAQKIMGPKGIGLLYARRAVSLEPIIMGGGQEKGRRSGTENLPLVGAFAAALVEAQKNTDTVAKRISTVRDFLYAEIKKQIPDVVLHGALLGEGRVANNLNISIPRLDGEMAVIALDAKGVAASTRSACDTQDDEPSHVLKAIGVSTDLAKQALRLTLLPTATKNDAAYIAKILARAAVGYRT